MVTCRFRACFGDEEVPWWLSALTRGHHEWLVLNVLHEHSKFAAGPPRLAQALSAISGRDFLVACVGESQGVRTLTESLTEMDLSVQKVSKHYFEQGQVSWESAMCLWIVLSGQLGNGGRAGGAAGLRPQQATRSRSRVEEPSQRALLLCKNHTTQH